MDPTTAVRTDTLPAIATLIVPGAVATSGYLWLALSFASSEFLTFLDAHEAITAIGAVLIWIAAGFAIESLGSYVEVYCIDGRRDDHKAMIETWWKYLTIAWSIEPVGQKYLRRMLVIFKFELNGFIAALLAAPSPIFLLQAGEVSWTTAATVFVVLAAVSTLLFLAAKGSANVLADTRACLVSGVWEPVRVSRRPQKRGD